MAFEAHIIKIWITNKMRMKQDILTILHLAEKYQEQYIEMGLCLSPEQNDASFRDFVWQYYSALHWGKELKTEINTSVSLF